jgi:ferritin-like metal-binding protein YciE
MAGSPQPINYGLLSGQELLVTDEMREIFTTGLRNAHAMENQALSIMRAQVTRIEKYPQVAVRLEKHVAETEEQVRRLDTLLDGLGERGSALKDTALSMFGSVVALGHSLAGDEIIKNSLANFAFENYEIAAYTSLIILADAGGFGKAIPILEQNLAEEKAMARWLENNLANVTLQFAQLRDAGEPAKI